MHHVRAAARHLVQRVLLKASPGQVGVKPEDAEGKHRPRPRRVARLKSDDVGPQAVQGLRRRAVHTGPRLASKLSFLFCSR